METIKWRRQYDYAADAKERERTDIDCSADEVITKQAFKNDADLNVLVERFGITAMQIPPGASDPRFYGDVSAVPDLRTALDVVRDATDHFNALPPKLRARFDNSPAKLYDFVMDEANADECVRLGLLVRQEPGEVPPAPSRGSTASQVPPSPAPAVAVPGESPSP